MAEGVGFEPIPLSIYALNFQYVNISLFSLTDGLLTVFSPFPGLLWGYTFWPLLA